MSGRVQTFAQLFIVREVLLRNGDQREVELRGCQQKIKMEILRNREITKINKIINKSEIRANRVIPKIDKIRKHLL